MTEPRGIRPLPRSARCCHYRLHSCAWTAPRSVFVPTPRSRIPDYEGGSSSRPRFRASDHTQAPVGRSTWSSGGHLFGLPRSHIPRLDKAIAFTEHAIAFDKNSRYLAVLALGTCVLASLKKP